jgi:AcrR family transcriptional regulator
MTKTPSSSPPPRRRTGGRSAKVREAVLGATHAALLESGYSALSIRAIAEQAGVHETSIYRRWGTKAALVIDAFSERPSLHVPTPDTGSLRGDLRANVGRGVRQLQSPDGRAFFSVLPHLLDDPDAVAIGQLFWDRRFDSQRIIFERAEQRGELRPGIKPEMLFDLLAGPMYYRLFMKRRPLSVRDAFRMIDLVLGGLMARPD